MNHHNIGHPKVHPSEHRAKEYIKQIIIRYPNSTSILFQDGSTQQLKPYNRRSSRATLRPLSRKDIFYSGSVYNLALEMQEQKMMTDQSLLKGRVLNP